MPQQIEKLMLKEHKKLDQLLDNVEKDLEDHEKTKNNFDCFKWNMEKHFFTEEKVIFDSFVTMSGQQTSDTFNLLEDHVRIMNIIKIIEKRLNQKIKPRLHYLKQIIQTHRSFEDEDFYPRLDTDLTQEQKKQICSKIMEIVPC
tara:strand:+ start:1138 stop:1569 length:432 start_codon:yes stop_codon:yes gene_type:complete